MTAMELCIKKYSKTLITKAIIQRQSVLDSVKVQFLPHSFPEVFGRNGLYFGIRVSVHKGLGNAAFLFRVPFEFDDIDIWRQHSPSSFLLIYPYPTQNKL